MYNMMDINTNYYDPMQWFQMQSMANPFAGQTNFMPGMNIGDTSLFMPMPYMPFMQMMPMFGGYNIPQYPMPYSYPNMPQNQYYQNYGYNMPQQRYSPGFGRGGYNPMFDVNRDGKLDDAEKALMNHEQEQNRWKFFDRNRNGKLDDDEQALMDFYNQQLKQQDKNQIKPPASPTLPSLAEALKDIQFEDIIVGNKRYGNSAVGKGDAKIFNEIVLRLGDDELSKKLKKLLYNGQLEKDSFINPNLAHDLIGNLGKPTSVYDERENAILSSGKNSGIIREYTVTTNGGVEIFIKTRNDRIAELRMKKDGYEALIKIQQDSAVFIMGSKL